jgi:hypothetical protein
VVAAATAAVDVRTMVEDPALDPKLMTLAKLNLALLDAITATVENGITPLSAASAGKGGRGGTVGSGPPVPPSKPVVLPGIKELRLAMEKADTESVIFDANLGPVTMANRGSLAAAFSAGIRGATIENAKERGQDPAEAVRLMDDAISCVTDMEFIGVSSKQHSSRNGEQNKGYCTMPVKLRFGERGARIHFETMVRKHCGVKASISLPKPVRIEQAAFLRAVRERYPGKIVTVRPDMHNLTLNVFCKEDKAKHWDECPEFLELCPGTMLPGYTPRELITLSPAAAGVPSVVTVLQEPMTEDGQSEQNPNNA